MARPEPAAYPATMRRLACAAALCFLCVSGAASASAPATALRIDAWPNGRGISPHRAWTLRCNPAGGTLPRAAGACSRLARLERPFAPIPEGSVCTQQYGGPGYALVRGRLAGGSVWAIFRRRDGCEIHRWERVAFLFPRIAGAGA